jgi:hypothetical protein
MIKRLLIYCLGLFIMALGVAVSVKSNLGVSPVNSMPYVLSEITQMQMGRWTMIVFGVYILIQFILLGKQVQPWRLFQILCTVLFGWFVDIANLLAGLFLPDPTFFALGTVGTYVIRLAYLVVSMALVGLGIFFYLAPHLLSLPGEGVMQVISEKFNKPLHLVKICFDCTVSLIALVLSLVFFHGFHGVREGTVFAAIGVGKFLGLYAKFFRVKLNNFIERPEPELFSAPPHLQVEEA